MKRDGAGSEGTVSGRRGARGSRAGSNSERPPAQRRGKARRRAGCPLAARTSSLRLQSPKGFCAAASPGGGRSAAPRGPPRKRRAVAPPGLLLPAPRQGATHGSRRRRPRREPRERRDGTPWYRRGARLCRALRKYGRRKRFLQSRCPGLPASGGRAPSPQTLFSQSRYHVVPPAHRRRAPGERHGGLPEPVQRCVGSARCDAASGGGKAGPWSGRQRRAAVGEGDGSAWPRPLAALARSFGWRAVRARRKAGSSGELAPAAAESGAARRHGERLHACLVSPPVSLRAARFSADFYT
jgi:hypothetical protein